MVAMAWQHSRAVLVLFSIDQVQMISFFYYPWMDLIDPLWAEISRLLEASGSKEAHFRTWTLKQSAFLFTPDVLPGDISTRRVEEGNWYAPRNEPSRTTATKCRTTFFVTRTDALLGVEGAIAAWWTSLHEISQLF